MLVEPDILYLYSGILWTTVAFQILTLLTVYDFLNILFDAT
jgi:hypothetical protein